MFVVCFGDGLGNQMFQYAFYYALKQKYKNNTVQMDIFNIYGGNIHNGFELNSVFKIKTDECSLRNAMILSDYCPKHTHKYWLINKFYGLRRYLLGIKDSFITQDDPTCYYDEVFHLSELKSYLFRGNWVNVKYFQDYSDEIATIFTFPELQGEKNLHYAEEMQNSNSVAVHIRRTDYKNSGMINLFPEYYKRAKQIIEEKVQNPKYYIFSDDLEDISDYLVFFDDFTLVSGNTGKESFRDMQLMSLCKHNIIPNSTFSFWGAFLNKNPDKIVIAPDKAHVKFRNPFACPEWTIIPNDG